MFVTVSYIIRNIPPLRVIFIFGNRKECGRDGSGKWRGFGRTGIECFFKNSRIYGAL
jgi:hypothetical protein